MASRASLAAMGIRLCYFDVDETLAIPGRGIPDELLGILARCRGRGIRLGLATGRKYDSALPYARAIGAEAPLILYNGARIQEPGDGEILFDRKLGLQEAVSVLKLVKKHDLHVNLYLDDVIYIERETEVSRESAEKDGVVQEPVGDLVEFLKSEPTKLLIIGPGEKLIDLWADFGKNPHTAEVVRSEPTYLEILPAGVSKGAALREVSRLAGVPLAEIAAFGDSNNDVEMIEAAGLGVAVGNALSNVKAAADYVAAAGNGLGVAEGLLAKVLEEP
jgi:Cof subfamily protein (haloacid dehalogenase superfamily)